MTGRNTFDDKSAARIARVVHRVEREFPEGSLNMPPRRRRPQPRQQSSLNAYYFAAAKKDDTNVTVANIRYRYGITQDTLADTDVEIPAVDGTYYVFLLVYRNSIYYVSLEVSDVNTHPDQSDQSSLYKAWRNEICAVVVSDNVIASVTQIWPGHIMAVEGRVV